MPTRQTMLAIALLLSANANAVPPRALVSESLNVNVATQTGFIGLSAEQFDVEIEGQPGEFKSLSFRLDIANLETGEFGECSGEVIDRNEILTLNARATEGAVTLLIDPATCFNIPGTTPQKIAAACAQGKASEGFSYTRAITNTRSRSELGQGTAHVTDELASAECTMDIDDAGAMEGFGFLRQFIIHAQPQ